jgi:hypothetical protein
MGAWGSGPFENDDALDWVWELQESKGTKLLGAVIAKVNKAIAAGKYLEAPEGTQAQAAGEVVAAIMGRPAKNLPDGVTEWLSNSAPKPDAQLATEAAKAVQSVATYEDSELRQLWEEANPKDSAAWKASMEDLLTRLRG